MLKTSWVDFFLHGIHANGFRQLGAAAALERLRRKMRGSGCSRSRGSRGAWGGLSRVMSSGFPRHFFSEAFSLFHLLKKVFVFPPLFVGFWRESITNGFFFFFPGFLQQTEVLEPPRMFPRQLKAMGFIGTDRRWGNSFAAFREGDREGSAMVLGCWVPIPAGCFFFSSGLV